MHREVMRQIFSLFLYIPKYHLYSMHLTKVQRVFQIPFGTMQTSKVLKFH